MPHPNETQAQINTARMVSAETAGPDVNIRMKQRANLQAK